jgi:hypothetical protein
MMVMLAAMPARAPPPRAVPDDRNRATKGEKMKNELERALTRSDALSNALACRLGHDDHGREGFAAEIAVLEELEVEANQELERVRREHGIEG